MNKIIWALILSILVGYSGGVSNNMSTSTDEQIKVAIYPTGTLSESYCFVLNTDGELIAEKGTRKGDDIIQDSFIKDVRETKKKKLLSFEVKKIIDVADEVFKNDCKTDDKMIKDSWEVQIFYNGKVIKQNYWHDISPQVKELVDEFINISPIDVDLHGWS